jgi:hypothetical protein
MYSTAWGVPVRVRVLLALAACLAAFALSAAHASTASADCTSGSSTGCLPGSGYTFNIYWDCGVLAANTPCWYPGTTNLNNAIAHTWCWGSADYDGGGNTQVCVSTVLSFGGCGLNLWRSCYYSTCNDQNEWNTPIAVSATANHTITGHAEA